MGTREGMELSGIIRQRIAELNRLCEGLDEKVASTNPPGRWSPKEILSHISGPDGAGLIPMVETILKQDTPTLDFEVANPFFTGRRASMTLRELLSTANKEYEKLADLVDGLSEDQLARKAHVPLFKETPVGEYPTVAAFVRAMTEHHLDFHIAHMKEILAELAAGSGA